MYLPAVLLVCPSSVAHRVATRHTTSLQSQKELFWFGSPGMMLVALQTIQFLLAIMVGAIIW